MDCGTVCSAKGGTVSTSGNLVKGTQMTTTTPTNTEVILAELRGLHADMRETYRLLIERLERVEKRMDLIEAERVARA